MPPLALAVKATSTYRIAAASSRPISARMRARVLGGTIGARRRRDMRAALWLLRSAGLHQALGHDAARPAAAFMHEYFECMVTTSTSMDGHVLKFMARRDAAIFNKGDDGASCRAALEAAERRGAGGGGHGPAAESRAARSRASPRAAPRRRPLRQHRRRNRLDFTVIGPAVNEVSRIEAMCRALDQDLIISAAFAAAARDSCDRLCPRPLLLRGVRQPQELFTLCRGTPRSRRRTKAMSR